MCSDSVIDLTLEDSDSEDQPSRATNRRTVTCAGSGSSDIEIIEPPLTVGKGKKIGGAICKLKENRWPVQVEASDDEIVVIEQASAAGPSGPRRRLQQSVFADKRLTRETRRARSTIDPADERLARQLEGEERREYREMIRRVHNQKEGIVFSVCVDSNGKLEDGSDAHPDDLVRFEPWRKLVESQGLRIKKFHWFVNYELEKRFEEARSDLEIVMDKQPEELQLFHGTASQNLESILADGFRIGGVAGHGITNGVARGYGVYLAAQIQVSLTYSQGDNRLFACRVLPGRITRRPVMHPPRSTNIGEEPFDSYSDGSVYVVRYTSLVLPCYVRLVGHISHIPLPSDSIATTQMIELDTVGRPFFAPAVGGLAGRAKAVLPPAAGADQMATRRVGVTREQRTATRSPQKPRRTLRRQPTIT
ncbi:hypothetical protein FISHEDRAFT_69357 [Fistulina hepatica ATCC 64428]|uniref:PARP catalytic domain-containing protein n=1 Tax=Fistulina hepatica ATCC 64428 TaxID=1128425 RepID=A0A0D7AMB8_9AGAR|nr:hypothetical protein FISHEDRAFT_69357 [Fistulina hepatica ATCC 64428]